MFLAGLAFALSASTGGASGGTQYGALKLSGAIHGTFDFSGVCGITGVPRASVLADGGPVGVKNLQVNVYAAGPLDGRWRLVSLTIVDFDLGKPMPTIKTSLATTRSVGILVTAGAQSKPAAIWQAGWLGTRFGRFGSGRLTMASNGRTGSLTATLANYSHALPGTLTATGNWTCQ